MAVGLVPALFTYASAVAAERERVEEDFQSVKLNPRTPSRF
jgi:hypothetical protein